MTLTMRTINLLLTLFAILGITACTAERPAATSPASSPEQTDVFVAGDGYPIFRIPSIVTTNAGTLLAFAEGRQRGSDHAENDIVLRRSTDGGRTWEALQVVAESGKKCLNNPEAVVLPDSGRILLMYQEFPEHYHSVPLGSDIKPAEPGFTGDKVQRSFLVWSDDDGKTWSKPVDLTKSVKRPAPVISVASGPGIGIVLQGDVYRGRIVMPFNESYFDSPEHTREHWKFNVYAVFSDDGGKTWRYGDSAPCNQNDAPGWGNEVQMVERADGSILLNSRSFRGAKLRKIAVSQDGGTTWSELTDDPNLPEPECMGSILRYSNAVNGEKSRILFSCPGSREKRTEGTIRLSYDEGATWPVFRVLVPEGLFAYSCLTKLADGTIGCLYERDHYNKITLARFPLSWLESGGD